MTISEIKTAYTLLDEEKKVDLFIEELNQSKKKFLRGEFEVFHTSTAMIIVCKPCKEKIKVQKSNSEHINRSTVVCAYCMTAFHLNRRII